ncbi:hypothetical protein Q4578_10175 [Shimia thalassica]|uniref:hypothetical protein n=1 Tax=Shimia thalassica TaxID=1715693 RepID=UPI0026E41160|nr:hypothetical protein [Shimia thalassica]MDO6521957.1 hypothetical protein [Shimia thalassica]
MSWYGLNLEVAAAVQLSLYLVLVLLLLWFFKVIEPKVVFHALLDRFKEVDPHIKVGVWSTVAVLMVVFLVSGFEHCSLPDNCSNKVVGLLKAPANEVGDALAGIAGALAFLWIIVTVMMQSKELASQREELRLTRRESKKMAAALEAQAEIFRDEQRQRKEDRLRAFIDEQLKLVVDKMHFYRKSAIVRLRMIGQDVEIVEGFVEKKGANLYRINLFGKEKLEGDADESLQLYSMNVSPILFLLDDLPDDYVEVYTPRNKLRVAEVISELEKIEEVIPELDASQLSRLNRIRFARILKTWRTFYTAPFWMGDNNAPTD